ncbi:DDE-type integrase/transposase/recombinase [Neorhizobium galegae]|uniref:DDE-type integrase/transposase/recombinase n=2 Tax=Neorhizobium galegae TaxID=399 RepID=UPI00351D3C59
MFERRTVATIHRSTRNSTATPARPNMVWVAEFSYIRIAASFCYLAVILDACSRKVVGRGLSKRLDTPLALASLHSAIENRRPPPGCIHCAGPRMPIRKRNLPTGA